MAKIDIKGLVIKRRGAKTYCYWQPNAGERKAGWTPLALGADVRAAQGACEAQNAQVEAWRDGGAKPRAVAKFVKRGTVDQLIAAFKTSEFPRLRETTQKQYRYALGQISDWAGAEELHHITRARAKKLRDVLLRPDRLTGEVQTNRASGIFRVGATLFAFALREELLPEGSVNPFAGQRLPTPPPRDQIWSPEAVERIAALAIAAEQPGLALAILLAREIGQREGDLLKLSIANWIDVPRFKLEAADWDRLAEPDPETGRPGVCAFRIRQGKTRRWIEIPVVGETRRLVEAAIARARAAGSTILLLERQAIPIDPADTPFVAPLAGSETHRWLPWHQTRFQRAIAAQRDQAARQAVAGSEHQLAEEIAGLQFRDLRRTAVVWLGELGIEDHLIAAITGHKLEHTRKILETYLPRTTKMAGRAIALRSERTGAAEATKQAKGETG